MESVSFVASMPTSAEEASGIQSVGCPTGEAEAWSGPFQMPGADVGSPRDACQFGATDGCH
jgi:hypothetical protein